MPHDELPSEIYDGDCGDGGGNDAIHADLGNIPSDQDDDGDCDSGEGDVDQFIDGDTGGVDVEPGTGGKRRHDTIDDSEEEDCGFDADQFLNMDNGAVDVGGGDVGGGDVYRLRALIKQDIEKNSDLERFKHNVSQYLKTQKSKKEGRKYLRKLLSKSSDIETNTKTFLKNYLNSSESHIVTNDAKKQQNHQIGIIVSKMREKPSLTEEEKEYLRLLILKQWDLQKKGHPDNYCMFKTRMRQTVNDADTRPGNIIWMDLYRKYNFNSPSLNPEEKQRFDVLQALLCDGNVLKLPKQDLRNESSKYWQLIKKEIQDNNDSSIETFKNSIKEYYVCNSRMATTRLRDLLKPYAVEDDKSIRKYLRELLSKKQVRSKKREKELQEEMILCLHHRLLSLETKLY